MAGTDPAQPCADPCAQQRADDIALANGARDLADAYQQNAVSRPGHLGRTCAQRAPQMREAADRFDRYGAAIPSARAADDLNQLGDGNTRQVSAPCLERLPLDADALNRELGIPPGSPNAITPNDLRNDTTGHRAAIYRSKTDGRLIMVSRDTQPDSLVDWKTNIENGQGFDTDQYAATRRLATKMNASGQNFDISGYSKGGGLAQEAGLLSPNSNVYVFNSAGLHEASLARTGQGNFQSLKNRTHSFSAENDFLTFMNTTTDPGREVRNAQFLRTHLAGEMPGSMNPMAIQYSNPEHRILAGQRTRNRPDVAAAQRAANQAFQADRARFLESVDQMIAGAAETPDYDRLFPPVRSSTHDTVPGRWGLMSGVAGSTGASGEEARFGKLVQHKMSQVLGPMEAQLEDDRNALQNFMRSCGS
ncbi:Mbeg1-like protein [Erythrobacter sp. JK5]|uniref:Mbeg1-like protein n=1 Tax=Erythrobacter sp. JK5 TaxID=2829500 RepID=UPI001BABCC5B|nr:Mbeg1-like protein [Erythrobacter sp. JK5]QUL38369.1 DUF2974 domain-containing protein [Erythrobacter sp. JK5]